MHTSENNAVKRACQALSLSAAMLFGLFVPHASASVIALTFEGTINAGSAPVGISVGDAFSGTLTYDTAVVDLDADPTAGRYSGAITGISVTIGAFTSSQAPGINSIFVGDGFGGIDRISFNSPTQGNSVGGFSPSRVFMSLTDSTASVYNSDALVSASPPVFGDFDGNLFQLSFAGPTSSISVSGTLSQVAVAVAEPHVVGLMVFGLLLFAQRRKRAFYRS